MKIQLYKKGFLFLVSVLSAIVLFTACKNNTKDISSNLKTDKGHTDFNGAMEYEFNMIKNPITGKIPEGSFEGELAQARALLAKQQQNNIVAVNAYSLQGPTNLGGRTRTLAYDVRYNGTTNRIIMAGGVSGGVYKSYDDGAAWFRKSPTGDHFSCTSIAQDTRPGGPGGGVFYRDTWYYTTGEFSGNSASASGATYFGRGAYKSTDNGETWTHIGLLNSTALESPINHRTDLTTKVVVDPTNGNVYVAALDAIYRSTDGGATWGFALTSTSGGYSTDMLTDIIVTSTGQFYASFSGLANSLPDDMPGVWTSPTGAPGSWTKIAGSGGRHKPSRMECYRGLWSCCAGLCTQPGKQGICTLLQ